ncbi:MULTISPECIES: OTU domain-containing protein [unclassified Wolbachia]|uniref:hypothetical protein n=1 Tax=unclassified Wolbachia TaxID=2640676 RepID=UPI0021F91ADA|nr:hypothetical protein [Wolbachia endosymbiont (group B) of Dolichovespula media]
MENSKKKTISEKLEGVQYLKQPDLQSNALLFKRSDNNPELPENFKVGKAVGGGDCFFDSVAQGLRQLKPEIVFTVKPLREICKKFAESQLEDDYSWLKEALKGENQQINEYITRIEFTAGDVEQKPEPNALGMVSPIWGRGDIEGRIICKVYGVQLHILEKHIVEEREVWLDQLISSETSKSIDNINYNEQNTVHIINAGNAHFNPIINHKNLQASVEQSSTQRKRTKTDSEEDRMEDTSSKKLKTSSQAVEIVGLDQAKKVLDDEEIEITSVAGNMSVQAMARLQNKPTYQKWEQKGFDINNYQGIEEYSPSKADDIPTTSIEEKQQSATKSNKPLQDHIPDNRKEFLLSVLKSAEINGIKHFNTHHGKISRIGQHKLTMTLLGIALELDAKEVISCIHKLAKNKGELEKVLNSTSHTLELQNGKILHHTPISWAIRRGNVSQISTI